MDSDTILSPTHYQRQRYRRIDTVSELRLSDTERRRETSLYDRLGILQLCFQEAEDQLHGIGM